MLAELPARDYVDAVNKGDCAIYLWEGNASLPRAWCSVTAGSARYLADVLGPRNARLDERDLNPIRDAFAELGVHHRQIISAVEESLIHSDPTLSA